MPHERVTAPHHIICEGRADVEFFEHLLRHRAIQGFDVSCGQDKKQQYLGKTGFLPRLTALQAVTDPPLRGVIVVVDVDNDPGQAFQYARDQIAQTQIYPIPLAPLQIAKEPTKASTAVLLIPNGGKCGHLDALLLECVGTANDLLMKCVNEYCKCTPIAGWDESAIAKAKLRLLISALHRQNPGISLAYWVKDGNRAFDYNDPHFDFIEHFLRDFVTNC